MSAFVLLTGVLFRAPEQKTSKSGNSYLTATMKVAADNSSDFWNIMAFSDTAQAELSRLGEGDKLSAQGSLKIELYTGRDGQARISRTCFADQILALKPKPKAPKASNSTSATRAPALQSEGGQDFDDSIPF